MNEAKPNLKLEKVVRTIPEFSLEADFQVGPGERAALVGRSGSGKTTLLRMIAGLDPMDSGRIFLGASEISQLAPEKRQIGYVFQDQALFPALHVLDNATFGLRVRGVSKSERNRKGQEWLEKIGLSALALRKVTSLSGGEKQRVAFVRALIWQPSLILLDEPFSALDRLSRDQARQALLDLHQLWPVPMILVTHDESDVSHLATSRLEILKWTRREFAKFRKSQIDQP